MAIAVEQLQDTHAALIAAVQAGDWQQVGELDNLCRELVQQAMAEPERNEAELAEVLGSLSATYREVIGLCQAVQGKLAEELQGVQRSKQGARVYQMFS
ncbi:MAG: flagellar protein FliT [Pseudomonas sp.]